MRPIPRFPTNDQLRSSLCPYSRCRQPPPAQAGFKDALAPLSSEDGHLEALSWGRHSQRSSCGCSRPWLLPCAEALVPLRQHPDPARIDVVKGVSGAGPLASSKGRGVLVLLARERQAPKP